VVVAVLWTWQHGLLRVSDWAVPLDYSGDTHEMLARIKAASEGDTLPLRPQLIERLGAPWGASWNAYPASDKLLVLFLGQLSRLVGLAEAANLALLLGCVTAALAFHQVARRFHAREEWALVGAVLFALATGSLQRGLAHLLLVFTWTIPLGLLCCWQVARRTRLRWGSRDVLWSLGAALALGVSNPYNLFFWVQLLGWALLAQAFGARHASNLRVGALALGLACLAFAVMHAELWLYAQGGALPLLVRNYGGTEMYALKPVELFIPPAGHRWDWFSFWGERYERWSEWRGEAASPYLGAAGLAGFAWLLWESVARLLRGQAPCGFALQSGWILAYGALGGITNLLALYVGLHLFRATNRVSLLLACLSLLFLARRLSTLLGGRSAVVRWGGASVLAVFGVADQLPPRPDGEAREVRRRQVESDRAFGRALEERLPSGAMVFQLPVQGFPEVRPPHRLRDYELFRPYLHTSSLRFTYGAPKHRSRSRWQRDLEEAPVEGLVSTLERYGFAALHVNRRGFEDRGEGLMAELASLGYTQTIEGVRGEQAAVLLRPVPAPELPLGRTLTFGRGWYLQPVETDGESVRWSHGPAVLTYFNPDDRPLDVTLHLRARAATDRRVRVTLNGRTVAIDERIGPEARSLGPLTLRLRPGVNRLDVTSTLPPVVVGGGRARLRGVGLSEVRVEAPRIPALRG
jgi:hypothetical protein